MNESSELTVRSAPKGVGQRELFSLFGQPDGGEQPRRLSVQERHGVMGGTLLLATFALGTVSLSREGASRDTMTARDATPWAIKAGETPLSAEPLALVATNA